MDDQLCAQLLDNFVTSVDSFPAELASVLAVLREKGNEQRDCKDTLRIKNKALLAIISDGATDADDTISAEESETYNAIVADFNAAIALSDEQITCAKNAVSMVRLTIIFNYAKIDLQIGRLKREVDNIQELEGSGFESTFGERPMDIDEEKYCTCRQPSYGDMIACDGEECDIEWFHYTCVGLTSLPKGSWFCNACIKLKL